jgi:hypothetical protein
VFSAQVLRMYDGITIEVANYGGNQVTDIVKQQLFVSPDKAVQNFPPHFGAVMKSNKLLHVIYSYGGCFVSIFQIAIFDHLPDNNRREQD